MCFIIWMVYSFFILIWCCCKKIGFLRLYILEWKLFWLSIHACSEAVFFKYFLFLLPFSSPVFNNLTCLLYHLFYLIIPSIQLRVPAAYIHLLFQFPELVLDSTNIDINIQYLPNFHVLFFHLCDNDWIFLCISFIKFGVRVVH